MSIETRIATAAARGIDGNIAPVAYGRMQIGMSSPNLPDFDHVSAVRIGGNLFIAAPHGDEALDYEWETGKMFGT